MVVNVLMFDTSAIQTPITFATTITKTQTMTKTMTVTMTEYVL